MLAEVDYLRDERQGMQLFMQELTRVAFTYAPPTLGQLTRAIEVDWRLADLRLGLQRCLLLARADVEVSRAETARPIGTEEEARAVSRQRREVFA